MNKYPDGKISEDDEGTTAVTIRIDNNRIILDFGRQTRWIGFDRETAITWANAFLDHAAKLETH